MNLPLKWIYPDFFPYFFYTLSHTKLKQFYNQLKIQFEKAASLQNTALEYRQLIESSNNTALLKKALDAGEISLINYLMGLLFAYSAMDNLLKSEYELNKALSFLAQFETQ